MKVLSMVAAAVLMTATGSLAQAPEAAEPAKPERKVCRSEKMTGSLTRVRRICMTQSEWNRAAENTRRSVAGLERDANQTAATQIPIVGGT